MCCMHCPGEVCAAAHAEDCSTSPAIFQEPYRDPTVLAHALRNFVTELRGDSVQLDLNFGFKKGLAGGLSSIFSAMSAPSSKASLKSQPQKLASKASLKS